MIISNASVTRSSEPSYESVKCSNQFGNSVTLPSSFGDEYNFLQYGKNFSYYFFKKLANLNINSKSYQLALVIPGIFPSAAIFLNSSLDIPNFLIYPLGLPDKLNLLCNLTCI